MLSHKNMTKAIMAVIIFVMAAGFIVYQVSRETRESQAGKQESAVGWNKSGEQESSGCVIFLHSGGFVIEKNEYHEQFGKALGEALGYDYLVPDYPINTTYKETLAYMEEIYKETIKKYDTVIMVGCSAGANLAVSSMINYGEEYGMPSGLILMSPWLDTTMENEEIVCVSDFDTEFFDSLVEWGSQYNGGDTDSELASPIKASKEQLKQFPKTVMIVGDQDILRFDAQKFQDNLTEAGCDVTYLTAEGKNHGEVFAEYASTYVMPEIMVKALDIVGE